MPSVNEPRSESSAEPASASRIPPNRGRARALAQQRPREEPGAKRAGTGQERRAAGRGIGEPDRLEQVAARGERSGREPSEPCGAVQPRGPQRDRDQEHHQRNAETPEDQRERRDGGQRIAGDDERRAPQQGRDHHAKHGAPLSAGHAAQARRRRGPRAWVRANERLSNSIAMSTVRSATCSGTNSLRGAKFRIPRTPASTSASATS